MTKTAMFSNSKAYIYCYHNTHTKENCMMSHGVHHKPQYIRMQHSAIQVHIRAMCIVFRVNLHPSTFTCIGITCVTMQVCTCLMHCLPLFTQEVLEPTNSQFETYRKLQLLKRAVRYVTWPKLITLHNTALESLSQLILTNLSFTTKCQKIRFMQYFDYE